MRDAILVAFLIGSFWGSPGHGAALVDSYLERYFQTFPSAATAAGRHDLDRQLEDLGPQQRQAWLRFNRETVEQTRTNWPTGLWDSRIVWTWNCCFGKPKGKSSAMAKRSFLRAIRFIGRGFWGMRRFFCWSETTCHWRSV